jgi:hypothetical protein
LTARRCEVLSHITGAFYDPSQRARQLARAGPHSGAVDFFNFRAPGNHAG